MRIGPRHNVQYSNITSIAGQVIPWVDSVRWYLGIFIILSTKFKCSLDHAKKSFYRLANGIFGKVVMPQRKWYSGTASKSTSFLYGLEVCPL